MFNPCLRRTVEGDVRLVNEKTIENWVTGRLEVFFEGSWSQVCDGDFGSADANVACRQLGFGAGTIEERFLTDDEYAELGATPVFPEVAISASGCTGTEERLIDCAQELDDYPTYSLYFFGRSCFDSDGRGLHIACVRKELNGTDLTIGCIM